MKNPILSISRCCQDGKYPISKVFDVWALFSLFVCRLTQHIIHLSSDSGVGGWKVDTIKFLHVFCRHRWSVNCKSSISPTLHAHQWCIFSSNLQSIASIANDDEWQNHRSRQEREWERMGKTIRDKHRTFTLWIKLKNYYIDLHFSAPICIRHTSARCRHFSLSSTIHCIDVVVAFVVERDSMDSQAAPNHCRKSFEATIYFSFPAERSLLIHRIPARRPL